MTLKGQPLQPRSAVRLEAGNLLFRSPTTLFRFPPPFIRSPATLSLLPEPPLGSASGPPVTAVLPLLVFFRFFRIPSLTVLPLLVFFRFSRIPSLSRAPFSFLLRENPGNPAPPGSAPFSRRGGGLEWALS